MNKEISLREAQSRGGSAGTKKQNAARRKNGKKGGRPGYALGTIKEQGDRRLWRKTAQGWKPLPKGSELRIQDRKPSGDHPLGKTWTKGVTVDGAICWV